MAERMNLGRPNAETKVGRSELAIYRAKNTKDGLLLPLPDATGNPPTNGAVDFEAVCSAAVMGKPTPQEDGTSIIDLQLYDVSEIIRDLIRNYTMTAVAGEDGITLSDGDILGGSAGATNDDVLLFVIPAGTDARDNTRIACLVGLGVFEKTAVPVFSPDGKTISKWDVSVQTLTPSADIIYHASHIGTPGFTVLNGDVVNNVSETADRKLLLGSNEILHYFDKKI